ncbi:MAG: hypothetical protein QOH90_1224, partial [Actinomycetota bacterium]|nr:hypothetical protein [Actinomycetota bacterium]
MQTIYDALDLLQLFVYVGLALVAFVQWRRRGGQAAGWLAATFGVLGAVVLFGRFLPMDTSSTLLQWVQKVELAVLVLFPYFLYRFMASFDYPPEWMNRAAVALTGVTVAFSLALPKIPQQGDPSRPALFELYIVVLLAQWVFLSVAVAVRLWRGGRGQPTVARRRMRTLSLGSIGLAIALVIAGSAPSSGDVTVLQVVVQILALTSAGLFLLGFAPPGIVRLAWRREEEKQLRDAELGLMEAVNPTEVAEVLLPHVSQLVGGRGSLLIDSDGQVMGSYGLEPREAKELAATLHTSGEGAPATGSTLSVPMRAGALAVQASAYTPFFGREETEMLQTLAVLAELALGRAELFGRERESREQLAEAQAIAKIGSWEWDLASGHLVWSDEMYRIYGLTPGEFEPTYDSVGQFSPEGRDSTHERVQAAIERDEPLDAEQRIVRPDGIEKVIYARGKVLRENGVAVKLIG